ncbi:hypothetical protein [Sphingobium sp. BS19]|uniref:hypothetical protein n=1 Tax=Sphingobium sp. BS19 TaxID=3018973 RepID=UPI0022EF09BD|nr:hypothetical protein [Sphingobium sp. BS19]GLI97053.1 hypothetical protein Sbs19_08710 [Sphingobium sp. BS19]
MKFGFVFVTAALFCAAPAFAGTKLWGDFEAGMIPQQVVDVAVKIPGVSSAKIKQKKDRVEVNVSHGMYSKFEVAGKKSRLNFTFRNGVLFAVDISPEPYEFGTPGCIQGGVQAFRYYDELLKTKYERNYDPTPNVDDSQVNLMIARANLATLSKERYAVPVDSMAAGYSDGKVQIINRVRFAYLTVGLCGRQGNLRGSTSLSYMDKAEFEAAAKLNQNSRDQAVTNLGKDL